MKCTTWQWELNEGDRVPLRGLITDMPATDDITVDASAAGPLADGTRRATRYANRLPEP